MRYLNGWHPFEAIRFDVVKITMWRCLILQIWEQQKQLLRNQRVIKNKKISKRRYNARYGVRQLPRRAKTSERPLQLLIVTLGL